MGKKTQLIAGSLIVLLHILAFSYQWANRNIYLADSHEYLQEAENILHKGLFYSGDPEETTDPDLFSKRPPIYPLFISLFSLISENDILVIIFQNILSLLNILIMLRIARTLKLGSGPLMLLLLIFSPVQVIYANLIMSEILLQNLLLLMIFSIQRFLSYRNPTWLVRAAFLLTAAMLTKPVIFPLFIIFLLLSIYYAARHRKLLLIAAGMIPVVFVIAYNYFNFQRSGYYHFSSISTINLVDYNTNFFISKRQGVVAADSVNQAIHRRADEFSSYAGKQKYLKKQAMSIIQKDFPAYLIFHLKGSFRFFIDPGRFDLYNFFGLEEEAEQGFLYTLNEKGFGAAVQQLFSLHGWVVVILILVMLVNGIKSLGLLLFLFMKQIPLSTRLLIAFLPAYIALITGPLGASRFMLPVLPFLLIGAAVFYSKYLFHEAE